MSGSAAFRSAAKTAAMLVVGWTLAAPAGAADQPSVPEPEDYRIDDYRAPVPKTLAGARVVDGDTAERVIEEGNTLLIDVYPRAKKPPNLPKGTIWRDPTHQSIEGAYWLPNVGYGMLPDEFEAYFKTSLATLASNDKSRPMMFFCQRDCWMSWNAAKRALEWGYTDVIWFPDGTDAWLEHGHDLVKVEPFP